MSEGRTFLSQLNVFNKENYQFSSSTTKKEVSNSTVDADNGASDFEAGQQFATELDQGEKQLGILSCIGLICNRMLGTGVFAVSSTIYTLCGSVGLALIMWAVGAIIAISGLYVYMEFGTAIPKNGGEKNYLEAIFRKPKFFITCMYAAYIFFLGWAAGNSINTAIMFLTAADTEVTKWNQRGIGVAVVFFAFLINSLNVKIGLYLQNILGIFKIGIVLFISITGWVALGGGLKDGYQSHNFRNAFEGTETPPLLMIAGPTSMVFLAIIYIFVNIAYFAVVPKDKLISSKLILAADFFDIVFGGQAKRAAAALVGLSALGNVLSVIFSQGRIIQQLGREGVLPFSNFFASSKPFNSPMVGLFQHFIVCTVTILAPPPGDAYLLVQNLISYPMNIINFAISAGLLWIYWQRRQGKIEWNPPIKAGVFVTGFFTLSNLYLIIAPYVPPSNGESVYSSMPYWIHCVIAWGIFFFGGVYYVVWAQLLPRWGHYKLVSKDVLGEDGFWRVKIAKVYDDTIGDVDTQEDGVIETNIIEHYKSEQEKSL
ncbi:Mup1p [Saccharomyces cerevisiae]|nr:Mup1p [Saccharomyces cerevisiae]